jgi:hypothetical protein
MSYVIYNMLYVICNMLYVICHMSFHAILLRHTLLLSNFLLSLILFLLLPPLPLSATYTHTHTHTHTPTHIHTHTHIQATHHGRASAAHLRPPPHSPQKPRTGRLKPNSNTVFLAHLHIKYVSLLPSMRPTPHRPQKPRTGRGHMSYVTL